MFEKQSIMSADNFMKYKLVDIIFLRLYITDNLEEIEEVEWLIDSFRFLNSILDDQNADKIAQVILIPFFKVQIFILFIKRF